MTIQRTTRDQKIIVLKATNSNADLTIKNEIYASANKPTKDVVKFVLIEDSDALGIKVCAIGNVREISKIPLTSKVLKVYNYDDFATWNWEFKLAIKNLRRHILSIEDVFLPQDLDYVKHTQVYTYVDSLKSGY